MASSDLAAYLAAAAALVSTAVNVGLSARFSKRNELHRWRRDVLFPTIVRFLEASDQLLEATEAITDVDFLDLSEDYRRGVKRDFDTAYDALTWSNAQVELIATPAVTATAGELRHSLSSVALAANIMVSSAERDRATWRDLDQRRVEAVRRRREAFLTAARDSLGIPRLG
jgi:hypothetical protein